MLTKKSQLSMELVSVIGFLLVFAISVTGVVVYYVEDIESSLTEQELNDFVGSIMFEIELAQDLEEGYYIELDIPEHLIQIYSFQIISNTIIVSTNYTTGKQDQYHYELPSDINVTYLNEADRYYLKIRN